MRLGCEMTNPPTLQSSAPPGYAGLWDTSAEVGGYGRNVLGM